MQREPSVEASRELQAGFPLTSRRPTLGEGAVGSGFPSSSGVRYEDDGRCRQSRPSRSRGAHGARDERYPSALIEVSLGGRTGRCDPSSEVSREL